MELLFLTFVGMAFCLTILLVGLKLMWLAAKLALGLVFLPLKFLAAAAEGFAPLILLPVKLAVVLAVALFLLFFPILLPILVVGAIVYLQRAKPLAS